MTLARMMIAAALSFAAVPAVAQLDILKQGAGVLGGLQQGAPGRGPTGAGLTDGEIGAGLKDALRVGADRTIATVGRPGGFLNDRQIRIPLPGPLAQLRQGLAVVGMGGLADDLELKMNRAAEAAAPKAKDILVGAIGKMTLQDARGILTGPQDSATQYFRRTTSGELTAAFRPIVDRSLADVGAVKSLNAVTAQAKSLPFAGGAPNLDFTGYVVGKALDGIFFYIAREEAAIRSNPAQRSTDLLKKVFGG